MRPFQVFATMAPDRAERFFARLQEGAPAVFQQAVIAAAAAMKSRPGFLRKQPFPKRAAAVRRALSRVGSDAVAEEMLAVYFLECRKELLLEWLEAAGVAHEEGMLKEDRPAEPEAGALRASVERFRSVDDDEDRDLLLRAFAAQSSVDWPVLDALLAPGGQAD